ncbi:MAG: beta-lactamase family protein [Saprospiraceae bacterium]|nr:beta-lactamase family protein [Saprospiraceae bacterium]
MKKWSVALVCLSVLIGCNQNPVNLNLSDSTADQIDSLFAAYANLNTPGYAIGISKNGETLFKNGYGAANLDYNLPIETTSAFSIASVSKQFTAACIALLILEEKISLESVVSDYIPELKKYPDTLRIKHLIYNTSGLTDYTQLKRRNGSSWVTFNYFDIDECIETSIAQKNLRFKPGEQWDYSNVNFMLLTKVVEKVSGQAFSTFSKANLFDPLEMTHTLINDDITRVIKNRVTPYNIRNTLYLDAYAEQGFKFKKLGKYIQHPRNAPHYGGSGVVSTIDDLLKWTSNMETKKFGGQKFYDVMHTTLAFEHGRNNQAFGLYFGKYKNRESVAWEGGDYGISSQILRFPSDNVSIIVLSNLGSGNAPEKAQAIADILIQKDILK